jgi:hypothetical protein
MPKIHVDISNESYTVLNKLPRQIKGRFISAAMTYFLKTTEGQAIISFLCDSQAEKTVIAPIDIDFSQYPNLEEWSE